VQIYPQHCGLDLRLRIEGLRREAGANAGGSVQLSTERQQVHFTRARNHPLGHLALDGQHQPLRRSRRLQQLPQKGRGDAIRNVGDHTIPSVNPQLLPLDVQDVALMELDCREGRDQGTQRWQQAGIQFDCDHPSGPLTQLQRQRSQARADLQHRLPPSEGGRIQDALQRPGAGDEALTQVLVRPDAVLAQHGPRLQRVVGPNQGKIQTMLSGEGTGVKK
jgi:hypothetical protein